MIRLNENDPCLVRVLVLFGFPEHVSEHWYKLLRLLLGYGLTILYFALA